jgi:hypothetical protein
VPSFRGADARILPVLVRHRASLSRHLASQIEDAYDDIIGS